MKRMCRLGALTIFGLVCLAFSPLSAQQITLKSADGSVEILGELLEFNGEYYRIQSKFGEMTLNALGLTCIGHTCPDPGQYAADITIAGTPVIVNDLLPGLIEDFGFHTGYTTLRSNHSGLGWTYFISDNARIPVARLQANLGSSTKNLAKLTDGRVDLVVSERPPTPEEKSAARQTGKTDFSSPDLRQILAVDALVFVVSPENPVSALTLDEITKVFSGQITNWAELGGVNSPISLYAPNSGTDIVTAFRQRFFPEDSEFSPISVHEVKTAAELSDAVMADPFAIGLVGFAGIRNAKPLAIKGACNIEQLPTAFSLQSGDYPLSRDFYFFVSDKRLSLFARNFLAFLETDAAQVTIADLGYVGLELQAYPLKNQQKRLGDAIAQSGGDVPLGALKKFVQLFTGAQRLSASFRFDDSSTQVDARSMRNIQTLARMIEVGDFDGKKLIFAGFSDSQGGAGGNRRISRQRAQQIAKLVKSAAARADLTKVEIQTLGMGEVSPLACNDEESGRKTNRRVEVWIK